MACTIQYLRSTLANTTQPLKNTVASYVPPLGMGSEISFCSITGVPLEKWKNADFGPEKWKNTKSHDEVSGLHCQNGNVFAYLIFPR